MVINEGGGGGRRVSETGTEEVEEVGPTNFCTDRSMYVCTASINANADPPFSSKNDHFCAIKTVLLGAILK